MGGVKGLESAAAEQAPIDHRGTKKDAEFGGGVDAATPEARADGIEAFGMLASKQRFGFAIAMLLL